jgi:hypothetical protein
MSVAYFICANVSEHDENHEFLLDMDGTALRVLKKMY